MNISKNYYECVLANLSLKNIINNHSQIIEKFHNYGIVSLKDLLFYLPIKYEDYTRITPINLASPEKIINVLGKIKKIIIKIKILNCYIKDQSGIMILKFFCFNKNLSKILKIGENIYVHGRVKKGKNCNEMIHPKFYILKKKEKIGYKILPIYSKIKGISQNSIRHIVKQAINILDMLEIVEVIPKKINLISLSKSIKILHNPTSKYDLVNILNFTHPAQKRLIIEELLAYMIGISFNKIITKNSKSYSLNINKKLKERFVSSLNFSLTKSQINIISEIDKDLSNNYPMVRIVQGEVGSGKTLIAAFAALYAISSSKQVALIAPTEILAKQHEKTFSTWFSNLNIKIICLFSKLDLKKKEIYYKDISLGKVNLIIGTHAIFQRKVNFYNLALIIIDEQHKFGVNQRFEFWRKGLFKGFSPHQLIITATPIPRTLLMMSGFGIKTSLIRELPKNRKPIITLLISNKKRDEVIKKIYKICKIENRQVYWICTLIKKSSYFKAQNAEDICKELKNKIPDISIGLMHGKIKTCDKIKIMQDFKKGIIKLLVTTTVIEVGVDVPNASIMIIENPERLGLVQLHQLRGRIGRGSALSYCILLYKSPINKSAILRLKIIKNNNDGFKIAKKDLEIRGEGNIFSTKQTGNAKQFIIANLDRDNHFLNIVGKLANYIINNNPNIAKILISRWISKETKYVIV